MCVKITDNILDIKQNLPSGTGGLQVVHKGTILEAKTETYLERNILEGETFILMSGRPEPKVWRRFKYMQDNDYYYLSNTYFDAVGFKAKRDVIILGFTTFGHYDKSNYTLQYKTKKKGGSESPIVKMPI